jgi:hypothetical protein
MDDVHSLDRPVDLRADRGISDDRILANAAAVTFYSLLALFPAIAALVSIYGLFADPSSIGAGKHRAPPKICRFWIRYHLYYINQLNP